MVLSTTTITAEEFLSTFLTLLNIAEAEDVIESPYYLPYGYLFWFLTQSASSQFPGIYFKTSPQWEFRKYVESSFDPREVMTTSSPRATRRRVADGRAFLVEPMDKFNPDIDMGEAQDSSFESSSELSKGQKETRRYPDFCCFSWAEGKEFRPFLVIEIKPPAFEASTAYMLQRDEDAYSDNKGLLEKTESQVRDQVRHAFSGFPHGSLETLHTLAIAGRGYTFSTFERKPLEEERKVVGSLVGGSVIHGLQLDSDFLKNMTMAFQKDLTNLLN
ncbi:hypothetical protein BDZ94DRAFT_1315738 [Collybia nuda]|uniref:Uncharacterized protein n=1 Tax=Collybia nuda TaxID=64659 RepID=A0A9P5XSD8_9AGAR|nr:hypothetical protein BDZ94DRAFT_1315738 [Collybia nuda]